MKLGSTSVSTFWTLRKTVLVIFLIKVLVQFIPLACAASVSSSDEDFALTFSQKVTLDKFKELMSDRLPHDYMKTDLYLVRWLRAKNFNIEQAEQLINEDLKWRRDRKMDSILEEQDVSSFPYFIDTFAKNGEPIITANFGDYWNLRRAALSGRMQQAIRQFSRAFEKASTIIRKLQREGKRVTKFHFIINFEGYSIISHGCLACMPFYLAITEISENHYPGMLRTLITFNTPPAFEMILQVIRPLMSSRTRQILQVYGEDKRIWRKALLEIADENQLSLEYGGKFVREQE